jgi:hypothetical protein
MRQDDYWANLTEIFLMAGTLSFFVAVVYTSFLLFDYIGSLLCTKANQILEYCRKKRNGGIEKDNIIEVPFCPDREEARKLELKYERVKETIRQAKEADDKLIHHINQKFDEYNAGVREMARSFNEGIREIKERKQNRSEVSSTS